MNPIDNITPVMLDIGFFATVTLFALWILAKSPFSVRVHFNGYISLGETKTDVSSD